MKTPTYRKLYKKEIAQLEAQYCEATDWELVEVTPRFKAGRIRSCRFSGHVRLGAFEEAFTLPGGIVKPSGINNATLHNVTVGDNCCIENVQNYIANYTIGHHTFIENVDIIMVDGKSRFGNGVAVSVLNETGGREVRIHNKLSAQLAYIAALYRHSPSLIDRINSLTEQYAEKHASAIGSIGSYVTILNTSSIKNVRIGDHAYIEGASRLAGGSINSNKYAPIRIGHNVICEDFIISSGSSVTDGTMLTRCFVGQSCQLGHTYSASDSLFFSNCQGENGEACAIFAGPFTVTHHKSTLLIAGVFSFMNAGSGSNQSNHMYKLGPIHQGTLERGAKTASDSYILWPSRVGAFSLVMGRHVNHSDTSNLPFSYLIEQKNTTYLVPGVNLRSVGTMRDAAKWPKRDGRKDPQPLDCINFNLLSPYTIQKILKGRERLLELQHTSGELSDTYSFQSAKIKNSSLRHGIELYEMAIHNFFGNILIRRLQERPFRSDNDIRTLLQPITAVGRGEWVDISGMIAPKSEVDKIVEDIKLNRLETLGEINSRFQEIHQRYSLYEWTWAHDKMEDFYAIDLRKITAHQVAELIDQWQKAVVGLDQKVYKDAQKEFSLASKTGFGADGSRQDKENDFEQVRGDFENNPFVCSLLNHMKEKVAQGEALKHQLEQLA